MGDLREIAGTDTRGLLWGRVDPALLVSLELRGNPGHVRTGL